MNVILFDNNREDFYPLSYTRPIANFRCGILTIKEKWEFFFTNVSVKTADYLSAKFLLKKTSDNLWIDSTIFPSSSLISELNNLRKGEALIDNNDNIIGFRNAKFVSNGLNFIHSNTSFNKLNSIHDIFSINNNQIISDFNLITSKEKSFSVNDSNKVLGEKLFIKKNTKIDCAILDTREGPIYIDDNVEIMPGSVIKGPTAILNNSILKIGAKIYGSTTIGPYCKIGGEVSNCVFFGYSSKAHDGFLGNSVIGEWCNLGADTNTSNLKNNYGNVMVWSYKEKNMIDTGTQYCGLTMGDHSKCGINTMFNTGTVVGVFANVFGGGFPAKFIPSFSWGGATESVDYELEKALNLADVVMKRRDLELSKEDQQLLENIFELTAKYRFKS